MLYCCSQKLANIPAGDEWLSAEEQAVTAGLRFVKRRNDWRLGRWTAKRAVCRYFGIAPEAPAFASLEIRAAADGAPELFTNGQRRPVSLSISHSEGTSFCAAGPPGAAVGCDIELVRPLVDNFVEDYFAAEEAALVERIAVDERAALALLIWSAKESALKSLRAGLRRDTRSVVVAVDFSGAREGWNPLSVRCRETSRVFPGWWRLDGGYVITITATLPADVPIIMV